MYIRKHKPCPDCGKPILLFSKFCSSCSQKGSRGNNYKDGSTVTDKFCKFCGNKISNGSTHQRCIKCYGKQVNGENNPNYKTGFYANNIMSTVEYLNWKLSVLERDNRVCQLCGNKDSGHTFQAHHIYPRRDFPSRTLDINNGVTLCKKCHEKVNKHEYDFSEDFIIKVNSKTEGIYVFGNVT
jgi:hypothetical protein